MCGGGKRLGWKSFVIYVLHGCLKLAAVKMVCNYLKYLTNHFKFENAI